MSSKDAHDNRRPIRVITVDGVPGDDDEAERASDVHSRSLDGETWWVRDFDYTLGESGGTYHLVRGDEPDWDAIEPKASEEQAIPDLADDPNFRRLLESLDETEREAVIKARVGQGPYRETLLKRWKKCSVSKVTMPELLVASHIKPWSRCDTAQERVDVANGLLLAPRLDRLFDRGLITFGDDFRIRISKKVPFGDRAACDIQSEHPIGHSDPEWPFRNDATGEPTQRSDFAPRCASLHGLPNLPARPPPDRSDSPMGSQANGLD